MRPDFRSSFSALVAVLLIVLLPLPQDVLAQEHVVSRAELHRDIVAASQARQSNQDKVLEFLSTDPGRKALKSANVPYEKVEKAVAQLSDAELARLAATTEKVQADFAGGKLSTTETYILIAVVTAVIILLIVIAARR